MHKNIPVVDLIIDDDSGIIERIGQIHNPAHLPVGTTWISGKEIDKPDRRKLNDWWVGRSIPASRENIQTALIQMRLLQTTELIAKCYGLSLSDQYWICPASSELKWADINFFDNTFSQDVGDILFGHEPRDAEQVNLMSPDNTSDGWLRKKWVISDGKRLLMKGGSGPYQQEPLNEIIACAVMKRLAIPHVPYTLTFLDELPYSLCETFVTTETELVPAWRIIQTLKQENSDSDFTHLVRCADKLSIPNVVSSIEKMLVLDYIIASSDRHYINFGFIRNVGTLKWHGFSPIYDSGTSLWHDSQFVGRAPKSKPFRSTHAEQIELVKDLSWFDYSALHGLGDECAEIFAKSELIDDKRRNALVRAIESRTKEIVQFAERPKATLSNALKDAQKKVDAQVSVRSGQSKKHDVR